MYVTLFAGRVSVLQRIQNFRGQHYAVKPIPLQLGGIGQWLYVDGGQGVYGGVDRVYMEGWAECIWRGGQGVYGGVGR